MRRLIPPLHDAMGKLIPMVDADTRAFNDYLSALGLPRQTEEQEAARRAALQNGLQKAVEVPLTTMRLADACWEPLVQMATHGNFASRSDAEVGAKALEAGIWGAGRNVLINLADVEDEAFTTRTRQEADALTARAAEQFTRVLQALQDRETR
jgi:glutamate formiminotransferase/formiminotetrahydrofolate cyclodeaminase